MSAWQSFYGWVLDRRRHRAAIRAKQLPRPVISIGNLHWGGGGKTPMVEATARHLRDRAWRPVILSRGHGRQSRGPQIVSRGTGPLVPVSASGDEPALLARLDGVGVVVAEDRYLGGVLALEELECHVFLLDDGFSHVRLARDLDILLFPSADPLAGGRLLPSGRLREPLAATQHAHAAVLTGQDATAVDDSPLTELTTALNSAITPNGWSGPTFVSTSASQLGRHRAIDRALLVTGVARHESVARSARKLADGNGFDLVSTLSFGDHHAYPARSLSAIRKKAQQEQADTILVTGKDMVKLEGRLTLPEAIQLVEIEHQARPEAAYFEWLDQQLAALAHKAPSK